MKTYEEAVAYLAELVTKQPYVSGSFQSMEAALPEIKAFSWAYGVSFSEMYKKVYSVAEDLNRARMFK